jgi:hypothetical protein
LEGLLKQRLPPLVGKLGTVPSLGNNVRCRARQLLGFFFLLEGAAHNHKEIQIEFHKRKVW